MRKIKMFKCINNYHSTQHPKYSVLIYFKIKMTCNVRSCRFATRKKGLVLASEARQIVAVFCFAIILGNFPQLPWSKWYMFETIIARMNFSISVRILCDDEKESQLPYEFINWFELSHSIIQIWHDNDMLTYTNIPLVSVHRGHNVRMPRARLNHNLLSVPVAPLRNADFSRVERNGGYLIDIDWRQFETLLNWNTFCPAKKLYDRSIRCSIEIDCFASDHFDRRHCTSILVYFWQQAPFIIRYQNVRKSLV